MFEKNIPKDIDLFEYLRRRVKAIYISDMRYSPHRETAIHEMARLPLEAFEIDEWNDALNYLLHVKPKTSKEEIRKEFLEYIN